MTIVVGTDLSEPAGEGVRAAAFVARALGEQQLCLVHVIEPQGDAKVMRQIQDAAEERLTGEVARIRELTGVAARPFLLAGSPWQTLVDFAANERARLLVVASRGRGGSSLFRLGSTSERVVQASSVPVLVVRDAAGFEAWAEGRRAISAVVAVDESPASRFAYQFLGAWRQARPCDVLVSHVYRADEVRRRYGLAPRLSVVDPEPEAERMLVRDLGRELGELPGEGAFEIRPQVGLGRIGDLVVEVALALNADLLVVGTHRRRGLSRLASTTSVVLHYSAASVLVVPAPADAVSEHGIPQIGSVLVATDLSAFSNQAVPHAHALLGNGGELHLVHVCPPKLGSERRAELLASLRALRSPSAAALGITTRVELIDHSEPAAAILQAAERVGADVVCLASHARGGVRGLLGSVADEVVQQSRRPVLVVRPPPS